ncbi:MAG: acyl carrier protein [bacterium]
MEQDVKRVIAAVLGIDEAEVADDAGPGRTRNWDSLKQMQIMLALEDEYGGRFGDQEMFERTSLSSIVDALTERAGGP